MKAAYFLRNNKAQASIEFSLAFVLALLFLFCTCNLFVWLNHNIVQRQIEYENTRIIAATSPEAGPDSQGNSPGVLKGEGDPGYLNFYNSVAKPGECHPKSSNYKPLNIFTAGGYNR